MILTHLTQPILLDTTDLLGLCGVQYARRDPRTDERWHTALAIPPDRLAYMHESGPPQGTRIARRVWPWHQRSRRNPRRQGQPDGGRGDASRANHPWGRHLPQKEQPS